MEAFPLYGRDYRLVKAAVLALGTLAFGGANAADVVTSPLKLPLQDSVSITSCGQPDSVDLTGQVHTVVKFRPGEPCRIHTNLHNARGTSMATGAKYKFTGADNFVLQCAADNSFSFSGSYRLMPTKPCKNGQAKATFQPLYFQVTLDNQGAVSAASVAGVPAQE
jgi:hypothetical protein